MQVMYDSLVGVARVVGKRCHTPRLWLIKVWSDDLDHSLSFRPSTKCYMSELSELIADTLRKSGASEGRIRWIATAR